MNKDNSENSDKAQSRRQFIRRVGGAVFAINLVDVVDGSSHEALAAACGTGGNAPFGESDIGCGVGIYPAMATDQNCGVSQFPNKGKDADQYCTLNVLNPLVTDPDKACGDCDDKHSADQHCGKKLDNGQNDPDEMCGHQSNIGGDQDNNCSEKVADVGCGTHDHVYGGDPWKDPDQHCVAPSVDQNCAKSTPDETCNSKTFPSTTSPDEGCAATGDVVTDPDGACSHYDADESCTKLSIDPDQSCGTYPNPIPFKDDFKDADEHCIGEADNSEKPNEGPLKPWCPNTEDADFWDPPPPQS